MRKRCAVRDARATRCVRLRATPPSDRYFVIVAGRPLRGAAVRAVYQNPKSQVHVITLHLLACTTYSCQVIANLSQADSTSCICSLLPELWSAASLQIPQCDWATARMTSRGFPWRCGATACRYLIGCRASRPE